MATQKTMSGTPMIPVTADACWSKRSYRTNYTSLSGVGAIIGVNTGKVLHIGVKNKYCVTCIRSKSKNQEAPKHQFSINHKGILLLTSYFFIQIYELSTYFLLFLQVPRRALIKRLLK